MPELPEVETIKRIIEPQLQGLSIRSAIVKRSDIIAYPGKEAFCRLLTGQTVRCMERRGKFLLIHLESKDRIILHLRMTGCLLITPAAFPEEKHTHIIFQMSDGMELRFSDTRRFGRFWLLCKEETDIYSGISKLGIEPFDTALTAEYLSSRIKTRKKSIKQCLLDQSIIAGIGNIYSDEILFTAGINPARPANSLKDNEWERLAKIIPERLSYFIQKNVLTPEEYLETKGKEYRNTPFLQVYGHRGEHCPNCGTLFCHIVVGGRSSVYCPDCQKDLTC
ncbi:bifunctional DNA-formamidopyrimidine glycosylase/DNA-(apurinic or apyrimidinic site) lyase [Lachnospiraceae bacterium 45-W7]